MSYFPPRHALPVCVTRCNSSFVSCKEEKKTNRVEIFTNFSCVNKKLFVISLMK